MRREYQRRLKRSLQAYLRSAHQGLQIPLDRLGQKAERLDATRRFSPAVYVYHADLREALKSRNVTGVMDALHAFSLLPEEELYAGELRIDSVLTERWESSSVRRLRAEVITTPDGQQHQAKIRPLLSAEDEVARPDLLRTIELLRQADPDMYAEFAEYVTRLKLFRCNGMVGASSPDYFGAVHLRIPSKGEDKVSYYLEHLVHETSHQHMHALMATDPMLLNPQKQGLAAPIRPDLRPLVGIFHATFVLSRMARTFRRAERYLDNPLLAQHGQRFRAQFDHGYRTLREHAEFTPRGRQVFSTLEQNLA